MNEETIQPVAPVVKRKGHTVLIIIMLIIILLLIGAVVFLLLNGKCKKCDNASCNNEQQSNNGETNKNQEGDNNAIALKALEFAGISCGGVDFTFSKKTVSVDEISVEEKLGMLATILLDSVNLAKVEPGVETEIDTDIYDIAKRYFDVTPEMEKQMEEGFSTSFYLFKYKNKKSYIFIIIGGCTAPENEGDYVKLKDSKIKGNTLINSYYYYYLKNDDIINDMDPEFTNSYFKDKNSKTPIYSKIKSENAIYLSFESFDTYDLYFDISNGNMKLIKVVYNAK